MLEKYLKKRNFGLTPEPAGNNKKLYPKNQKPVFVIQEHHASHLHYDFRLEVGGVLKSWAVPKGMPESYKAKHLAIATEDHPLEYAHFSGTIPKGEYGGGKVIIWDKGYYENITVNKNNKARTMKQALKDGHILVRLHGKRLTNVSFILQKFATAKEGSWLLIRIKDEGKE